jgi:hypothetical protein
VSPLAGVASTFGLLPTAPALTTSAQAPARASIALRNHRYERRVSARSRPDRPQLPVNGNNESGARSADSAALVRQVIAIPQLAIACWRYPVTYRHPKQRQQKAEFSERSGVGGRQWSGEAEHGQAPRPRLQPPTWPPSSAKFTVSCSDQPTPEEISAVLLARETPPRSRKIRAGNKIANLQHRKRCCYVRVGRSLTTEKKITGVSGGAGRLIPAALDLGSSRAEVGRHGSTNQPVLAFGDPW